MKRRSAWERFAGRPGTLAAVSDNFLYVVPSDPWWRPDPGAGRAAGDLVASLALAGEDRGTCEVDWSDGVELVDCGENLERIGCALCGSELPAGWFRDGLDERYVDGAGFATLDVAVPCCGAETTFNDLDYRWPMAFARFAIAVRNGSGLYRSGDDGLLGTAATAAVEQVLGHSLRQVRARY